MSSPPSKADESPDLDSFIDRFETAWREGRRPAVEDALAAAVPEARGRLLIELVYAELEFRLKAGEAARVEDYLRRFPDLAGRPADVWGLIVAEHRCRMRRESDLSVEEYRDRFPQWRAELDRLEAEQATRPEPYPGRATKPDKGPGDTAAAAGWPVVPGYEILGVLGRGGMGVVYKARQRGLNRVVALKMLPVGDAGDLARFRAEAETLAHLQHPHIVQVHEVGEHGGRPFFSLEYMEGGSLAERAKAAPLAPRAAAGLMETVARAVHAAHQRGVVHRDLKPGNVLLTADGAPKVADFGLAKRLDGAAAKLSQTGLVMGTPGYMPPEQAAGRSREISPASDVYSLGAVLYELLTGRPPHQGAATLDVLVDVLHKEPTPPRRLTPGVPADLETICLKCLRKEPHRRYVTAEDLADDLRRFLDGRPITARPVGRLERGVLWATRQPATATAYGLVLLAVLLAAAGGGFLWLWRQAEAARADAARARDQITDEKKLTEAALGRERAAKEREATAKDRLDELLYLSRVDLAYRDWREGELGRADKLLDVCPVNLRHWEWRYVKRLCHPDALTLPGRRDPVEGVDFSSDGGRIVAAYRDGTTRICDAHSGREILTLDEKGDGPAYFSFDGKRLVRAVGQEKVGVWDARTGVRLQTLAGRGGIAVSPADDRVACPVPGGLFGVWDCRTGELLFWSKEEHAELDVLAFSRNGKRIASGSSEGTVKIWDAQTGAALGALPAGDGWVRGLALSPGGDCAAVACSRGGVKVWDVAKREVVFSRDKLMCHALAFSPDGARLAVADGRTVQVRDASTGDRLFAFTHLRDVVQSVGWSGDGLRLASGGGYSGDVDEPQAPIDGEVKVWDATSDPEGRVFSGVESGRQCFAFSPDADRLAFVRTDHRVGIVETSTGREIAVLPARAGAAPCIAFLPDGDHVVVADRITHLQVWDATKGTEGRAFEGNGTVRSLAVSKDGRLLAAGETDHTIKVWDLPTGKLLHTLTGHHGPVHCLAFSPDGGLLVSAEEADLLAPANDSAEIKGWDVETGRPLFALPAHALEVIDLTFSPDGARLVSADRDQTARTWDVATRREQPPALPGAGAVAFSPSGKSLATASGDKVKIWEPASGLNVLTLPGHARRVVGLASGARGRFLASAGEDGTIRLWDATPEATAPSPAAPGPLP